MDPDASSASADAPAFITRPAGSPVYYGFPIIESSEVDGFRYGMITDFLADSDTWGDAFVVAPDTPELGWADARPGVGERPVYLVVGCARSVA